MWGIDYQEYLNGFFSRGSLSYRSQSTGVAELSEQFLGCTWYADDFDLLILATRATNVYLAFVTSTQVLAILPMVSTTEKF